MRLKNNSTVIKLAANSTVGAAKNVCKRTAAWGTSFMEE
jgi:hypothetical protein